MKPALTENLCTSCGLCCDSSLFADIELTHREAAMLEALGLEIEEDDDRPGELLVQPCRALKGKRCSIYLHRPSCCRTFECRLLQQVTNGTMPRADAVAAIAEARQHIAMVRDLIRQLDRENVSGPLKECYVEALTFSEESGQPPTLRIRDRLQVAMSALERFIDQTFLASPRI